MSEFPCTPAMARFVSFTSPVSAYIGVREVADLGEVDENVLRQLKPRAVSWFVLRLRAADVVEAFVRIAEWHASPRGPLEPVDVVGLAFQRALLVMPPTVWIRGDPTVADGDEELTQHAMAAVVVHEVRTGLIDAAGLASPAGVPWREAMEELGRRMGEWEAEVLWPALALIRDNGNHVVYSGVPAERDTRPNCIARLWVQNLYQGRRPAVLQHDVECAARRAAGSAWRGVDKETLSTEALASLCVLLREARPQTQKTPIYIDGEGQVRLDQTAIRDHVRRTERAGRQRARSGSRAPAECLDAEVDLEARSSDASESETRGAAIPDSHVVRPPDAAHTQEALAAVTAALAARMARPAKSRAGKAVRENLAQLLGDGVSLGELAEQTGIDKGNLSRALKKEREALARDPRIAAFAPEMSEES